MRLSPLASAGQWAGTVFFGVEKEFNQGLTPLDPYGKDKRKG